MAYLEAARPAAAARGGEWSLVRCQAAGRKAGGALEWSPSLRGGHTDTSSMVAPGDSFERRPRTAPARAPVPAPAARPATTRGGVEAKAGRPAKPAAPWGLWSLRPASFDAEYDRLNLSSGPAAKAAANRARTPASSSDSD